MKTSLIGLLGLVLVVFGCTRAQIDSPTEAMRLGSQPKTLQDDLPLITLKEGLEANVGFLKKQKTDKAFVFGPRVILQEHYIAALEYLIEALNQDASGQSFYQALQDNFEFFEVYGKEDWGEAFITSYYEPVIEGRVEMKAPYIQPLYHIPDDMVLVDMGEFADRFPHWSPFIEGVSEQKSRGTSLRGRLVQGSGRPGSLSRVVPYYDRREIDEEKALRGKGLEIVYVDPMDAFFLQIQGSGTVRLASGKEFKVGYAAQNGHPYVPIGKFLFDVIPREEMSLQKIKQHMRSLSLSEQQKLMNENPSYVFFQKIKREPITYMGTEVIAGRTIATDYGFFPKGTLAFLEFEKPVFSDQESIEPVRWEKTARFVIDQDTGGAIRGPHRVDIFWGRGSEAEQVAGVMKNWGRLTYVVPKQEWVESLIAPGDSSVAQEDQKK